MEQQRRGDPSLRRWNDLKAEEKLEIDRALFKGVRVSPEYADLAADKAAAMVALFAPAAWGATALAGFAGVGALFFPESGLSAWWYGVGMLVLAVVFHVVRLRYRRGLRMNTRGGRESQPDPELDHVVQLMRGSVRVQVAVSLVVVVGLVLALWLLR